MINRSKKRRALASSRRKLLYSTAFIGISWTLFVFVEVSAYLHGESPSNFLLHSRYSTLRYFQRFLLSNEAELRKNSSLSISIGNWLRSIKRTIPLYYDGYHYKPEAILEQAVDKEKGPSKGSFDVFENLERMNNQVIQLNNDYCSNTIQGRDLITDDKGFICNRRDLSVSTGCCSRPASIGRFSCHTCNLTSKCCAVYEHCVSCCQSPSHVTLEQARNIPLSSQLFAEKYQSVFEYCRGRCRHYSKSVVHENAYASESHHCFELPASVVTHSPPITRDELEGVRIVVAPPGVSCNTACSSSNDLKCDHGKLHLLNNCRMLEKFFHCRGSCIASFGTDQASEVIHGAPKHLKPGACLYNEENYFSCDESNPLTRRLCPCT